MLHDQTAEVTQQLIPQQAALRCAATTTTTTSEGGGRGTAHQIIPTLLYHGLESERVEKRELIRRAVEVEGCPVRVLSVVMTSYEVAIRDVKALQQHTRRYLCVDEGHGLKNHECRLTKSLNTFPPMNRLLLTGTALQNSLTELWALLKFLMQDIFDSLGVFESCFNVGEMQEGSDERILRQERKGQVISTLMKVSWSLNTFPPMNRLLLTGTALQNSLRELWALLKFLIQDIFYSLSVFESCFNVGEMQEGSDERILRQERKGQVISTLMKVPEHLSPNELAAADRNTLAE
ncbi:hypothetical protein O3P69_020622 [Scylla paramamosain]|uniref:Helicase ATP-binding domain-containing protein n=1 Tax=Scylla paramamosain TaxID=85552 RepID=A0AAW0TPY9_SCYPA